jgi:hypothetical protein avisC_10365
VTTSSDAGDDLLQILDELDQLITSARSVPMSSSAIVNRDDALALIDRARHAVPSAVRRAEEIVADADAVLADGREESERIVLHAQEEAERLVAGESVVRMAHERADEIVAAAEDRAADLRQGADEYSDRSLEALEAELVKIIEQVRAGRDVLASRLGEPDDADQEPQEGGRRRSGWPMIPGSL